jgi:hypothetical protein
MIYFPEYVLFNSCGTISVPQFKNGKWYIGSEHVSLTRLGILCKIDEEELILLKLTYGG